jgi:hypothetical protein
VRSINGSRPTARLARAEEHVGDLGRLGYRIESEYPGARSSMIGDIGIIGFTTKLRIIDLAGLASPVSLARENGQKVSLGRIVELSDPDIICLHDNPLNAYSINSAFLRHRSFDDALQKREFLNAYFQTDLGSKVCPFVFVSKDLAN